MTYNKWYADWKNEPVQETAIEAAFLEHVETALDTQDDRITTQESKTAGHLIRDEGTGVAQRSSLNFTGAGVTVTDNTAAGRTDVIIPCGGGGSGYSSIEDEGSELPQRGTIDFQGPGISASDGGNKTIVTVAGNSPTWDYDTATANGVVKLKHSFVNMLPNSGMENWINGVTSPPPPFTIAGATTISRVATTVEGSYAARVVFTNLSDEFVQRFQVPKVGEWYTFTAVVRRVSGTGTLRMFLVRDAFPFNNYFTLNTVPDGSAFHIVTITGQATFAEPMRVGFQQGSANGVGSTWEFESWTLQKGKGVATEHTPALVDEQSAQTIFGHKTFSGGLTVIPPAFQTVARTVQGNSYRIPNEGSFVIDLTVNDSVLVAQSAYDDVPRVINLLIRQDSVGNHPYRFSPSHIAWADGIMSENVTFDLSPNSHTYVRLIWTGIMGGFFGEIINSMPALYHIAPATQSHTYNGATGSAFGGVATQQLGFPIYFPRNIPVSERDLSYNAILRTCSLAMRQRINANDVPIEISYLGNAEGPRGMLSPDRPDDFAVVAGGYYLNREFGSSPGPAMVINRLNSPTEGWFFNVITHEICHAIEDGYYDGVNTPHPTHGDVPIRLHPALHNPADTSATSSGLYQRCQANGGDTRGQAEWMAEMLRQKLLPLDNGDPNAVPPTGTMGAILGAGTTSNTPAQRWASFSSYIDSLGLV